MKIKNEPSQTYDYVCFTDLVYEFNPSDKAAIEKKIKNRLKYHKLGDYSQERVDYIRIFKDDLRANISNTSNSVYFHKSDSMYSELADFDVDKMTDDYSERFVKINKDELKAMINFAIYIYHLR